MSTEIEISPSGEAQAVYSDDLAPILGALGPLHVERASHVEFANDVGMWGVWSQAGRDTGQRFTTRAKALEWEVRNISTLLDGGTTP